mmetsp:Transcript_8838/g.23193  ORF Transcript_8838/g.23193 Transcript_8838/m.23193 type:complete len:229 (-) Transcript_8838:898-1584(-)
MASTVSVEEACGLATTCPGQSDELRVALDGKNLTEVQLVTIRGALSEKVGKLVLVGASEAQQGALLTTLVLAGFWHPEVREDGSIQAILPPVATASSVKLSDLLPNQGSTEWRGAEEDLIDEEDLIPSEQLRVNDAGCGPLESGAVKGGRKACKNCSCGLAEQLEAEKKTNTDADSTIGTNTATAKSSCGNCYLGDGFRCASCPYLGMPPFKPGEKVQINSDLLTSDL